MAVNVQKRLVNPRLGSYFGIFASLFAAVFVLALIFSELGTDDRTIRFVALVAPLALYATLGVASFTLAPQEYLAAGRRVPAVYCGLVTGIAACGGIGLISMTGLLFFHGFDAWSLVSGTAAGLVLMAVLIAPFFRKFGSYSLPSFLGRRLDSRLVRLVAAAVFLVPIFLLLVAELRIGIWAARQLTGSNERWMLGAIACTIGVCLALGGMRSGTWSSTAQGIAALIAVIVVAGIAGLVMTNLPVSQLSYGPVLRAVGRFEADLGVPTVTAAPMSFSLAANGLSAISGRMADPFNSMGYIAYTLTAVVAMLGIAAAPWLVPRCTTTLGVHAARKSLSWAVFFYALALVTVSAIAVFMRDLVLTNVVGQSAETVPSWFADMLKAKTAAISANVPALPPSAIEMHRDAILFALPAAGGFSEVLVGLAIAGAIAAVCAAVMATASAMSVILAEDIIMGLRWEPVSSVARITVNRVAVVVVLALACATVVVVNTDPVLLFLWALTISASTAFPITVLTIWYKKVTPLAATAGLITGATLSILMLVLGSLAWPGLPPAVAAVAGCPAALIVAVVLSSLTRGQAEQPWSTCAICEFLVGKPYMTGN